MTIEYSNRHTQGCDSLRMHFRDMFLNLLAEHDNIPSDLRDADNLQTITDNASIGQLFTLANLKERAESCVIRYVEDDGTIIMFLDRLTCGLDLEGRINS